MVLGSVGARLLASPTCRLDSPAGCALCEGSRSHQEAGERSHSPKAGAGAPRPLCSPGGLGGSVSHGWHPRLIWAAQASRRRP